MKKHFAHIVYKAGFFWTISPKLKGIKLKIFLKLNENFPQNSKFRRFFPEFSVKLKVSEDL